MRGAALLLLAVLAGAGCAGAAEPAPPEPAQKSEPWTPEAAFEAAAARVAGIAGRGWGDARPTLKVLTREQWVAQVRAWHAPAPDAEEERRPDPYALVFETLGVTRDDPEQKALARVMEHNQAYYDRDTDEVYYFTDTPEALREAALGHALWHAMQRRHAPWYAIDDDTGRADDVSWAYVAAAEAEAVSLDLCWPDASLARLPERAPGLLDRIGIERMDGLPPYAVRWTYWSYIAGAGLARAHADADLRALADALRADPPVSTEQVLHPERRHDPPLALFAPDLTEALGEGWELAFRSVLGEWTLADWVRVLDPDRAPAPLGPEHIGGGLPDDLRWGGDLVEVYAGPGEGDRIVLLLTVWDDEASAERFAKLAAPAASVARAGRRVVAAPGPQRPAPIVLRNALSGLVVRPFRTVTELKAQ